jgi:hypothetical protein
MEAPVQASFDSGGTKNEFAPPETDTIERIVIKNADLKIVVEDPSASVDKISRMAEDMGGFVVSANVYQTELDSGAQVWQATMTIRVPAERLNDALEAIKAESSQDPLNENVSSQDVTKEYTDLQSQLRNLQAAEEQLSKIMESAVKTEDVLNVYNQLVQVRGQIEVTKGQIQYYEQSAAMSAVSIELIPNAAVQPLTIGGWQPVGVAKSAIQALINTLKFIVNAVIWILIFIVPVLGVLYVIFILPLSLVWRAYRRGRARRKEAEAMAKKEAPQKPTE